ncbi:MAG: hypothetical protein GY847_11510 [Proteobacteria bacterium]|nr:hypothetical protein [Pseudomonadota bacterium]
MIVSSRFPIYLSLASFVVLGTGCTTESTDKQEDISIDSGSGNDTNFEIDTEMDSDRGDDADAGGESDTDSETGKDWTPSFDTDPGEDQSEDIWTLMMYEAADNNLEYQMLIDVNEMEKAQIPKNVNVIVLIDRARGYDPSDGNWKGAKLFKIAHDETEKKIKSPRLADPEFLNLTDHTSNGEELDMGSKETLENFIDFCQKNFPADHYILHMSDHGGGWQQKLGVQEDQGPMRETCTDESSGQALTISKDIPQAIEGKGIEAVTIDACSLGSIEVAWALAPHTDYAALSVTGVPSTGWDYTKTLNSWFERMSAKNWVLVGVETYKNVYAEHSNLSYIALELAEIKTLGKKLDAFIKATDGIPIEKLRPIRNHSYRPDRRSSMSMRDISNLVRRIEPMVGSKVVDAVLDASDSLILYYWSSESLNQLRGLTIYAPGPGFLEGGPYNESYDDIPFAQETDWNEFLQSLI